MQINNILSILPSTGSGPASVAGGSSVSVSTSQAPATGAVPPVAASQAAGAQGQQNNIIIHSLPPDIHQYLRTLLEQLAQGVSLKDIQAPTAGTATEQESFRLAQQALPEMLAFGQQDPWTGLSHFIQTIRQQKQQAEAERKLDLSLKAIRDEVKNGIELILAHVTKANIKPEVLESGEEQHEK